MTDNTIVPGMLEQLHALYRRSGEIDEMTHADQRTVSEHGCHLPRMDTAVTENSDPKMRLVVEVKAHLDWLNPPATKAEEIMRAHANVMAAKAAFDAREVAALVVSQLLAERSRK